MPERSCWFRLSSVCARARVCVRARAHVCSGRGSLTQRCARSYLKYQWPGCHSDGAACSPNGSVTFDMEMLAAAGVPPNVACEFRYCRDDDDYCGPAKPANLAARSQTVSCGAVGRPPVCLRVGAGTLTGEWLDVHVTFSDNGTPFNGTRVRFDVPTHVDHGIWSFVPAPAPAPCPAAGCHGVVFIQNRWHAPLGSQSCDCDYDFVSWAGTAATLGLQHYAASAGDPLSNRVPWGVGLGC